MFGTAASYSGKNVELYTNPLTNKFPYKYDAPETLTLFKLELPETFNDDINVTLL